MIIKMCILRVIHFSKRNFINCYTDFHHDNDTYFLELNENITIPILNTFLPYRYPRPDSDQSDGTHIAIIVGVSIGSIFIIAFIVVVVYIYLSRRKYRRIEMSLELNRTIVDDFG